MVLHSLLVGGIDYSHDAIVMCGGPKMACSVTEGSSHDEASCGRTIPKVHRGTKQKCNREHGSVKIGVRS